MDKLRPNWNICVVTGQLEAAESGELANALLYGDEVLWLPIPLRGLNAFHQLSIRGRGRADLLKPQAKRNLESHQWLIQQILDGGLPIIIPEIFSTPRSVVTNRGEISFTPLKEEIQKLVNTVGGENEKVLTYLQHTRACIIAPNSKYTLRRPSHWDPNNAAQVLMQALSRVLLPDVSSLPLVEVAELREKVKDELDPMRGELLRLTEDLRRMVKNECSVEEVAREAKILITTRIMPAVSAANSHVNDQLNKGWKKYLTGTLKTISFVGVGFLTESELLRLALFVEAVKTRIETVADAITAPSQPQAPTPTAQFVIELRRHYGQRYNF